MELIAFSLKLSSLPVCSLIWIPKHEIETYCPYLNIPLHGSLFSLLFPFHHLIILLMSLREVRDLPACIPFSRREIFMPLIPPTAHPSPTHKHTNLANSYSISRFGLYVISYETTTSWVIWPSSVILYHPTFTSTITIIIFCLSRLNFMNIKILLFYLFILSKKYRSWIIVYI